MPFLELRIPPVLVVLILAAAMCLGTWLLPTLQFSLPGKWWVAAAFVLLGVGVVLLSAKQVIAARTTLDPRKPQKTRRLVTQGLFRYSRNPIYAGLLLLLLGLAVLLANAVAFILLPFYVLYMSRFQIQPEERFMRRKFGKEYEIYFTKVRRWI
ncbi:methyltransferase family protein [Aliidiomarina quisquiliarum]|uniref:methyltransferase family protein n=1 Tax=Aliidiomarina quisquiliarum TaxID=2938947 RepID=UPI00208EFADC|nr:isoprenylcysteine carboxylmethyltransferase family protein [Aliidiomarina quisquiliarum]MCO4320763.1 isoprenylcysteine carboxylmethyltransferase family protein [Aliidiomarina quisquiliarum]